MRAALLIGLGVLALGACNSDPGEPPGQVGYRDGIDGPNSGERGTLKISEIGWAGSVRNDGTWDPDDVFFEIRNEGTRPMNIEQWYVDIRGFQTSAWRIPEMSEPLQVGDHLFIANKRNGCFADADLFIEDLYFGAGDPFSLTLRDADERLIEPAGSRTMPPYAGIYDGEVTRSMEKVELIFGGRGSSPSAWHHYTKAEVDVVNNDRIAPNCRERTLASPGRPNSPDYSGAFAAGAFN